MNNRFKQVRIDCNLSMKKFGEKINISDSAVALIESGKRNVTERIISDVCRVFNVNEEWLRSGSGEMYVPHTRNQQIFDFMNRVMDAPDEAYLKRLCVALSELDERELEALCMIAEKISKQD